MFEAIKRHTLRVKSILKLLIVFLVVLGVLIFFNEIKVQNPQCVEEQTIYIFGISLNNWFTILSIITAIGGGLWAIHQYDKNRKLQQQEKASEIAIKFSMDIISKLSVISYILTQNQKFKDLLGKIDPDKLSTFSFFEIVNLSKDNHIIEKFEVILTSPNTQKQYEYLLQSKYNEDERTKFESNFVRLVETTLNQLEAMCMNISSQAAGSQFIYSSLHQVFLYAVHILSFMIAKNNVNNFDKYFINIIAVYNMWNKQKQKDILLFNKTTQRIKRLENKRDNEIKKLLNKKPRTV